MNGEKECKYKLFRAFFKHLAFRNETVGVVRDWMMFESLSVSVKPHVICLMIRFFLLEDYSGSSGRVNGISSLGNSGTLVGTNSGTVIGSTNHSSSSTASSPRTQAGYPSNNSTPHSSYNTNGTYGTMSPSHITPPSTAIFNAAASSRKSTFSIFYFPTKNSALLTATLHFYP